jgi:HEPN domain-containing protein
MDDSPFASYSDWLVHSRSDLRLAKISIKDNQILPEDSTFHAQQCAEKALKALLIAKSIEYPRTHSLEVLIGLLKESGIQIPEIVDQAFILTQYAVQTRYPGEWEPITRQEARKAMELAEFVLYWVEGEIKQMM